MPLDFEVNVKVCFLWPGLQHGCIVSLTFFMEPYEFIKTGLIVVAIRGYP